MILLGECFVMILIDSLSMLAKIFIKKCWTFVNLEKGKQIFEQIKDKIICEQVDFENAIGYNPSMTKSVKPDHNRERFFENLDKMPFDKAVHITILIISLRLFIYSKSNSADQASSTLGEMEVMSFNEFCLYTFECARYVKLFF